MAIKLLMPALSPTMKEGTLARWNKKEGDSVKIGDLIAEIETDKAIMEFESVDEGKIGKIFIAAGTENVKVNEVIAILLEEGEDSSHIENLEYVATKEDSAPKIEAQAMNNISNLSDSNITNSVRDRIFISPLANRLAKQNSINIKNLIGSGPRGRIIKQDIENFINDDSCIKINEGEKFKVKSSVVKSRNPEEYTKVYNNNMRKVIAKRLTESKRDIPHFYLEICCEMDNLLTLRKQINTHLTSQNTESKVSVNDLVIKAAAISLANVPEVNSSWTEEAILRYNNIDIAIAVAIEGGLITPIIRNANQKSIIDISSEMKELAARAKSSALKPEEFQGGSFTISNLGMFGIDNFKAIINPPQSGILAIGTTAEKAIVKNGTIIIASIMHVTLSVDHRVIDGAIAAKFLAKFKEYVENPINILIS